MTEAAKTLGVTNHALRRLIKTKNLAAAQVVCGFRRKPATCSELMSAGVPI